MHSEFWWGNPLEGCEGNRWLLLERTLRKLVVGPHVQLKAGFGVMGVVFVEFVDRRLPAGRWVGWLNCNCGNSSLCDWQDNVLPSWINNRGMFEEIRSNMYCVCRLWILIQDTCRGSDVRVALWRCRQFCTFRLLKGMNQKICFSIQNATACGNHYRREVSFFYCVLLPLVVNQKIVGHTRQE